jgi:hypothetical protein
MTKGARVPPLETEGKKRPARLATGTRGWTTFCAFVVYSKASRLCEEPPGPRVPSQERFASFPMDEAWLIACARYVELNPVRAGLVRRPEDWRWSSAGAHLGLARDPVGECGALLERIPDWRTLLDGSLEEPALRAIRSRERTGYALGSAAFLQTLESRLGRAVGPAPRGRPWPRVLPNAR